MKKYVKPELYYENFELTQHIAACTLKITANLSVTDHNNCNATGKLSGDAFFGDLSIVNGFVDADLDCSQQPLPAQLYCYYAGENPLPTHMS